MIVFNVCHVVFVLSFIYLLHLLHSWWAH